jgi:hypothetical protein
MACPLGSYSKEYVISDISASIVLKGKIFVKLKKTAIKLG